MRLRLAPPHPSRYRITVVTGFLYTLGIGDLEIVSHTHTPYSLYTLEIR
jgi:hypothetical protein